MAKWFGGERARGFQGWKFPLANDDDPTRLAMAAPSTRFGAELRFHERVARNGGRFRKTAITALARKLLVVFWKYVTAGVVIEGAILKAD